MIRPSTLASGLLVTLLSGLPGGVAWSAEPCRVLTGARVHLPSGPVDNAAVVVIGEKIAAHGDAEMKAQIEGLDRNYFREEDPRMPMLDSDRRTKISFGDN